MYIMIVIRIILTIVVDLMILSLARFDSLFACVHVLFFFPFRFRYLQENEIEELPNEGFNGLSRLKIL